MELAKKRRLLSSRCLGLAGPCLFGPDGRLKIDPKLADGLIFGGTASYPVTFGGRFYLEALLKIWDQGMLKSRCSACRKESVLIHEIGGSMLSGASVWWGACHLCGATQTENDVKLHESFNHVWIPKVEAAVAAIGGNAFAKERPRRPALGQLKRRMTGGH